MNSYKNEALEHPQQAWDEGWCITNDMEGFNVIAKVDEPSELSDKFTFDTPSPFTFDSDARKHVASKAIETGSRYYFDALRLEGTLA